MYISANGKRSDEGDNEYGLEWAYLEKDLVMNKPKWGSDWQIYRNGKYDCIYDWFDKDFLNCLIRKNMMCLITERDLNSLNLKWL